MTHSPHPQRGAANTVLTILVALVLILLLAITAGAAWALSSGRLPLAALMDNSPAPVAMSEKPLFKPLDKFVVSLARERSQHYLMVEMSLVSRHPDMPDQADELHSVIRNTLLRYFAGRTQQQVQEELASLEQLQDDLRDRLIAAAGHYDMPLDLDAVLLTNVVIQ